ncbi:hypothetical protein [Bacillus cereus]|uniref:hypothetical protein n=1 Tax=Bacillus cereus TaxID=1396 RepID=UPI000BF68E5F|nr:hypothetical protein [Bacillus cereus]PER94293.1 hypothetical protein CN500_20480 [Bacillus cereus]
MTFVCIPKNADTVNYKQCRVVNICAYRCADVRITDQQICKLVQDANKIFCTCNIMFNLLKVQDLGDKYSFDASEIDSSVHFITTLELIDDDNDPKTPMVPKPGHIPHYPTAEAVFHLKPCCTDGAHVNLYFIRGNAFKNGDKATEYFNDNDQKYFIMMAENDVHPFGLAHELGHMFGLPDDLIDEDSVMFPKPGFKIEKRQCEKINSSPLIQIDLCPVSFTTPFPKIFEVEFIRMDVFDVEDNDGTEPQAIELTWTFSAVNGATSPVPIPPGGLDINGAPFTWYHDYVQGGHGGPKKYDIGKRAIVSINNDSDSISIGIEGKEDDPGDDQTIPGFSRTFNKNSGNWGDSFGIQSTGMIPAGESDIHYEMFFKITEQPVQPQPIRGVCNGAIINP